MPDTDQAQVSEPTDSATEGESAKDDSTEKDQETQDTKQSKEKDEKESEKELLELPDGRKVDPSTLSKEWKDNFYPEFTRRSQQLAKYKRQEDERKATAESDARQSVAENEVLKNTPPHVKEALVQLIQPAIDSAIKERDQADSERRRDEKFVQEMDALEKEFPGGNGKPKFDRQEVYRVMQTPGNRNFDPRDVFNKLHQEDLIDAAVKESLKKQQGGVDTERTGTTGKKAPARKAPRNFTEAGQALFNRLKQSA